MKADLAVHVDDVLAADRRRRGVLRPTPLIYSERLQAWLKLESLQVTGAFKVRGAFNAVARQIDRGDFRPLVTASAGNHALGASWAARHFGRPVCVVVPTTAPATKILGCESLGARVLRHGGSFEDAYVRARELSEERGWRFLHAFDDSDVIAGQGTVALELAELEPDAVLVPIGGGSLAAGMGLILKARGVRVIGVHVEGLDSMARALRGDEGNGELPASIADGLRVQRPGALTRAICAEALDDIVSVSESDLRRTVLNLLSHERIVAEGAGAAAVAALEKVKGRRRVAVVTGGNIDGDLLWRLHAEATSCER